MVDANVDNTVANVDIDSEGIFKYILIKVYKKNASLETELVKTIVRGYADCQWHSDIYDRVNASISNLDLETECVGGGRIEHRPKEHLLKVYGYSQGFGKADHAETKQILFTKYPNYTIEISDEGY